jgi:hypothetical protein
MWKPFWRKPEAGNDKDIYSTEQICDLAQARTLDDRTIRDSGSALLSMKFGMGKEERE